MKPVLENPRIPRFSSGDLSSLVSQLIYALNIELHDYAYRINRVNPKDGSEFQRMLSLEPFTAADVTAAVNDWDPSPGELYTLYRVTPTGGTGNWDVTGLVDGAAAEVGDGRVVAITNLSSSNTITLKHENAGSAAENRFRLRNTRDLVVPTLGTVAIWYDGETQRWRELWQ